jgi:succinyl-CoA synthetase alpha subunit
VPGKYAKREALKAINAGVHVLLFSDNVALEDEIDLKDKALAKGLLMMGPDCGTAIINGVALGFANVIEPGNIGVVAAAGTGLQEVTTLISKHGGGISQAIGTGGRDVKEAVGGRMMLAAIKALAADRSTEVIVLVSKPPAQSVLEKILGTVVTLDKPVVACFLGGKADVSQNGSLFAAQTLEEAAKAAVSLSRGEQPHAEPGTFGEEQFQSILAAETARFQTSQRYIRGLYTGGTLCYEALVIAGDSLPDLYSNTPMQPQQALEDPLKSQGHTFIDLGEDEFTRGRPHPMIEPGLRNERILAESHDPDVAVVLLDVVLGYGAHDDPAGIAASAVIRAKQQAQEAGRYLAVVASVCGTSQDPQHLETQIETLQQAGVLVMPSNAQAVKLAIQIVNRQKGK